jgi:hypothetical protein
VSQYPRRVLSALYVPNGSPNYPGAPPNLVYVRAGTLVDIKPGSALELAYGGAGNLSAVLPVSKTGDEACLDKSALSN